MVGLSGPDYAYMSYISTMTMNTIIYTLQINHVHVYQNIFLCCLIYKMCDPLATFLNYDNSANSATFSHLLLSKISTDRQQLPALPYIIHIYIYIYLLPLPSGNIHTYLTKT